MRLERGTKKDHLSVQPRNRNPVHHSLSTDIHRYKFWDYVQTVSAKPGLCLARRCRFLCSTLGSWHRVALPCSQQTKDSIIFHQSQVNIQNKEDKTLDLEIGIIFWETFEIFNFSTTVNVKSGIILPIILERQKNRRLERMYSTISNTEKFVRKELSQKAQILSIAQSLVIMWQRGDKEGFDLLQTVTGYSDNIQLSKHHCGFSQKLRESLIINSNQELYYVAEYKDFPFKNTAYKEPGIINIKKST